MRLSISLSVTRKTDALTRKISRPVVVTAGCFVKHEHDRSERRKDWRVNNLIDNLSFL